MGCLPLIIWDVMDINWPGVVLPVMFLHLLRQGQVRVRGLQKVVVNNRAGIKT